MNHLNEDTLIQYAFDLLETDQRPAAEQHLDECPECRAALKQLQAKFAAMDTLAKEVPPSDELIRKTVSGKSHSVGGAHPANIPLYRRRWVSWSAAAAAVVLVCTLLLQNLPEKEPVSSPPVKDEYSSGAVDRGNQFALNLNDDLKNGIQSTTPLIGEAFSHSHDGVRVVSDEEIPNKPPFAPASAIELVVLPKPDKTQVTIYNSADLTLVRDTRKLTLKPGWNWIQFMWDGTLIDPTSLSLTPLEHADKIDIQQLVYPARLKDIGRWLIRSEVEGAVPFEITYFASGLSWRAFYMGTMNEDETTMDLKGYVNVSNNSGQDFVNTQTRLIVGQTRLTEDIRFLAQRRYPYGPDVITEKFDSYASGLRVLEKDKAPKEGLNDSLQTHWFFESTDGDVVFSHAIKKIEKTGLSEYFLYTIEGTEDLTNQWTKRLPSFDVKDISVKSLYKYDEDRYGNAPIRFVSFVNDTEHELGETPIPEGNIKIYRNVNEQQNLSYVGQSSIKYIPVNEDIELNLGLARLVKVEPVLIEQKSENYTFDDKGNIDGWDEIETYQVTVTNTRDIPVDIEITWNMGTEAWELDLHDDEENSKSEALNPKQIQNPNDPMPKTIVEYKKHDKNRARFTLTVPARSEKNFGITIRKYRQKRIEAYTQKMQEQEQ